MSIPRSGRTCGGIFDVRLVTGWMDDRKASDLQVQLKSMGLAVRKEVENAGL
jgi:hypothetical protein